MPDMNEHPASHPHARQPRHAPQQPGYPQGQPYGQSEGRPAQPRQAAPAGWSGQRAQQPYGQGQGGRPGHAQAQQAGQARGQARPGQARPQGQPYGQAQPWQQPGYPQQQPYGDRASQGAYRPATAAVSRGPRQPAAPVRYPAGGNGYPTGSYPSGAGAGRNGAYPPAGGGHPAGFSQPPKKKGGPWRVVFWAALVVLAAALVALGAIALSYWQGQRTYQDVLDTGFAAPSDIEGADLADLTVDWEALRAINPDTAGWIYVPGTNINYPIVHTTDNETYLTHDFKGSEGWIATFGAIFLAAENAEDFSDANNVVYGHHLNDGSMFAALADFEDQAVFDEHRTVYILTPQGNYRLSTFSLVHCEADDPLAQTAFSDAAEREAYVQDKLDRSVTSVSDAPAAADMTHTFAFATCDNLPTDGRWVLFAYVAESTVTGDVATGAAGAGEDGEEAAVDPESAQAVDDAAKEMAS